MGGVEDSEPPSKRVKQSPLLQFCTQSINNNSSNFDKSRISPLGAGLMARPLPGSKGKEQERENEQTMIGSKGVIKREEFVRIITKALYSLGYERTGAVLEEESGIQLHSPLVNLFRKQIISGDFDGSVSTLHRIGLLDQSVVKSASFLILERKFIELLENGNVLEAMYTLQREISPLGINMTRAHELASCILGFGKVEFEFEGLNLDSNLNSNPRLTLLEELQKLFPPSVMVPERRLEHLVEQALNVQREACYFHNLDGCMSLYTDHWCGKEQIPSRTTQVLDAHQDEVWFLQFSNNGKYLASASNDRSAIIWEVNSDGQLSLKHKLTGHTKPVLMVSFSPDDCQILTCGMEESVRLWDVGSGELLQIYEKTGLGLISCSFLPDGKQILTGLTDKSFVLWGSDGREVDSVKGQRSANTSDLAITRDGKLIISINKESNILLMDRESKSQRVIEEEQTITSFCLSEDDNFLLVNLINQEIHLWCIKENDGPSLVSRYTGHKRTRFAIRSCFGGTNQAFIASGSEDSQVYIWHRATSDLIETLAGHSGTVNCVSWNPKNPYMLASASDDHTIRIWGLNKTNNHKRKEISENGSCSNGIAHQCNGNRK